MMYEETSMKAAETVMRKSDTPRLPSEIETLSMQIEKTKALCKMLAERLSGVLTPDYTEEVNRGLDSVPTREPSQITGCVLQCQRGVQGISSQIDSPLQRLEI